MYGLVNQAIEEMVVLGHGHATWEEIKRTAGVEIELFVSSEGYPDEITYRLVGAACRVLGANADEILDAFGRHWLLHTGRVGYGSMLDAGGRSFGEFLRNLPDFHTRVSLIFPHLEPPRFAVTEIGEGTARLSYFSHREGLAALVLGILRGLGEKFDTEIGIVHDVVRANGADHDEFVVTWQEPVSA